MSMTINTNIDALNALRNLGTTGLAFSNSVQKLSSGLRINTAADDAAGLAIATKLSSQVSGLNQAQRNGQDGVSMVQTAEGALNQVQTMLQRIRELSVEAANSTLSKTDAQSVNAEITALSAEINRTATATTFNGQSLLTGALSVSQNGGTVSAGYVVQSGSNTSVTNVSVSGAKASTTYTLTSAAGGKLTLTDGTGNSQQLTVGALNPNSSETINFANMGVSITVASVAGETAANVAAGLAASGASAPTIAIGGTSGTNLVNGTALAQTSAAPVTAGGGVTYTPWIGGLDGSSPATATASSGVPQGTMNLDHGVALTGAISGSIGGETFTGTLAAPSDGANSSIVLTGTRGDTIQLDYKQGTGANWSAQVNDFWGASFTFVAGTGTATASAMTAAPGATPGTYTFTSSGPGSLTLNGQTATVANMGANATQTLTFGNIGFTLTSDANGMSAAAIVSNLLQSSNNSIVVTGTGGTSGTANTITTGAGSGATFQIGANAGDNLGVTFGDARTAALGGLDAAIAAFSSASTGTGSITGTASALITAADSAISTVSAQNSNFGAVENRLNAAVSTLSVTSQNLNASESRIRDLNVAAEMVNFTKTQILQQAGTAILAQANSASQNVMTLLR